MDVELLLVPECPNGPAATALLRTALGDAGLTETTIVTTLIDTQHQAEQRGFVGSPTILLDGVDPFADAGRAPGLACRVYRGTSGLAGVPDLSDLREALKRAAHR